MVVIDKLRKVYITSDRTKIAVD